MSRYAWSLWLVLCLGVALMVGGCGSSDSGSPADGDTDGVADGDGSDNESVESDSDTGPYSDPWTVVPSSVLPTVRGYRVVRGIMHNHSPYSHDGCDNKPRLDDGSRNEQCYQDDRDGMCKTRQDFIFMSDHPTLFADYEYPEVLFYKEGDTLIERDGEPQANWVNCGDGFKVLFAAGTEGEPMPLGLEHHIGKTPDERKAIYNPARPTYDGSSEDNERVEYFRSCLNKYKEAGGMAWIMHTEEWLRKTLLDQPIDGFEMYNLHANLMYMDRGKAAEILTDAYYDPDNVPVPELLIMAIFEENLPALAHWAAVSQVKHISTSMATDSHRNSFPGLLGDNERLDSFRRMMHWFSNYVLIPQGDYDDRVLKTAIKAGRMYGGFNFLGYPVGFDYHAENGATIYEMGSVVTDTATMTLKLTLPHVYRLDPSLPKPEISGHFLKANGEKWDEVAATTNADGTLQAVVDAKGVYRAEVRMVPYHLRQYMGKNSDTYMINYVWIYSNPIWLGDPTAAAATKR